MQAETVGQIARVIPWKGWGEPSYYVGRTFRPSFRAYQISLIWSVVNDQGKSLTWKANMTNYTNITDASDLLCAEVGDKKAALIAALRLIGEQAADLSGDDRKAFAAEKHESAIAKMAEKNLPWNGPALTSYSNNTVDKAAQIVDMVGRENDVVVVGLAEEWVVDYWAQGGTKTSIQTLAGEISRDIKKAAAAEALAAMTDDEKVEAAEAAKIESENDKLARLQTILASLSADSLATVPMMAEAEADKRAMAEAKTLAAV